MYTLYGALGSPYLQKIRALLRYRRLPSQWVDEGARRQAALSSVRAPVIPVLEYPDGSFANDSTPLMGVFKYQLKCLTDLRARYAGLDPATRADVDPVLGDAWLGLLRV